MRNFTAFLGLAVGANVGWLFGTIADAYYALVSQTRAGHKYAYVMTFVMAFLFAYLVRRGVGSLSARHNAAVAKVEHAEMNASARRGSTGRTPPSPFPAFQG